MNNTTCGQGNFNSGNNNDRANNLRFSKNSMRKKEDLFPDFNADFEDLCKRSGQTYETNLFVLST